MKEDYTKNRAAVSLGRRGGLVTSKNTEHMSKIGKKGSNIRWSKEKIKNQ